MINEVTKGRFELGRVVTTLGSEESITQHDILTGLWFHHQGLWGKLCKEDYEANEQALKYGHRILSAYFAENGKKFYIITEADRSYTTVMLPEEY